MKRPAIDLVALTLAAAVTAGVAVIDLAASDPAEDARAQAAFYLDATPQVAERHGDRYRVRAGDDTAWIDADSGELVEVEFGGY